MTPVSSSVFHSSTPRTTHLRCIASMEEHELRPFIHYDSRLPPPLLDGPQMLLYDAIWKHQQIHLLVEICKKVDVIPSQFLKWPEHIQIEMTKACAAHPSSWPHCFTIWLKEPACAHVFLKFSFEQRLPAALAHILAKLPPDLFFQALNGLTLQALSFTPSDWQQLNSALTRNNIQLISPIRERIRSCIAEPEKSLFHLALYNFSECHELSKNSLQHLATSTFPTEIESSLLANLWGNAFIRNTPLEGVDSVKAIDFMLRCLSVRQSNNTPLPAFDLNNHIASILHQVRSFHTTLNTIGHTTNQQQQEGALFSLAQHTIELIRSNSIVYIPGGWTDPDGGHTMCYIVEKKHNFYSFSCLNTGAGLDEHTSKIINEKKRYCPLYTLSNILPEDIEVEQFWMFLFGFLTLIPETENKKYDATQLYSFIQNSLHGTEVKQTLPDSQYIREQKSGVCSMQILWALLRTQLPFTKYYEFKFTSKLIALYRFYLQNKNFTESDRLLLHHSVERLAASTYRGFQKERLSQQLLIQSLGALQEIWPTVSNLSVTEADTDFGTHQTNTARSIHDHYLPFETPTQQTHAPRTQNTIFYYTKKTYACFSDFVQDFEKQLASCKALKNQKNLDALSYFIRQSLQSLPKLAGKTAAEKTLISAFWSQATSTELEKLSALLVDLSSLYCSLTDITQSELSTYCTYLCGYSFKILSFYLRDCDLFETVDVFSALKPASFNSQIDDLHLHTCRTEFELFRDEFPKKNKRHNFIESSGADRLLLVNGSEKLVALKIILEKYLASNNLLTTVKQNPQYVENSYVRREHLPQVFWDFFDLYGVCIFHSSEHIRTRRNQITHIDRGVYLRIPHKRIETIDGKTVPSFSSRNGYIKIPAILERALKNAVHFLKPELQEELYKAIFSYSSPLGDAGFTRLASVQHRLQREFETSPLVVQQLTHLLTLLCDVAIENDSENLIAFAHKVYVHALSFIRETKTYKKTGALPLETLKIGEKIETFIGKMKRARVNKEIVLLHLALYSTKNLQPLLRALFMSASIPELGPLRYEILTLVDSEKAEIKKYLERAHTHACADIFSHCPFIQPATNDKTSTFELKFPRLFFGKLSLDFLTGEVLCDNRIVCPAEQLERIPGFTEALLGEKVFDFTHTDAGIESDQTKIAVIQKSPYRFVQIPGSRLQTMLERFAVTATVDSPYYLYYDSEARKNVQHPLNNAIRELPPFFSRTQHEIWISSDKTNGFIFDAAERHAYKIEVRDAKITLFDLTKNRTLLQEDPEFFLVSFELPEHIILYSDNTTKELSIELPRYKLSFIEINKQFHSREFPGFFIVCSDFDPISHNDHYILLKNCKQEQMLLIPDCSFLPTRDKNEPLSRHIECSLPELDENLSYHHYSKTTSSVHAIQWVSTRMSELFLVKLYILTGQHDIALAYIKRNYTTEPPDEDEIEYMLSIVDEALCEPSPKTVALVHHLISYMPTRNATPDLASRYKEQLSNIPEQFRLSPYLEKIIDMKANQEIDCDETVTLSDLLFKKLPLQRQVELQDQTEVTTQVPPLRECYTATDVLATTYLKKMYYNRHDRATVAFTLMASHFKTIDHQHYRIYKLIDLFGSYIVHNARPPLTDYPNYTDFFTNNEKALISWGKERYKHLQKKQKKSPPSKLVTREAAKSEEIGQSIREPVKEIISYDAEVGGLLSHFDALAKNYIAKSTPQEHSTPQFPLVTNHSNPLTRELLLHLEKDYYDSAQPSSSGLVNVPELLEKVSSLNDTTQLLKKKLESECRNYFDPNVQMCSDEIDKYIIEFLQNITEKPDRLHNLFLWYLSLKESPQNDGYKSLVTLVDQLLLVLILEKHLLLIKKHLEESENPEVIAQLLKKTPLQIDVSYQVRHILLYFQHKAELILTQEQFDLIKTSQNDPRSVFQLSCGKGKTKVLTALKLLISLLEGKVAFNVVPTSNFETNYQDLKETVQTRTPFRVHAFSFNRSHTPSSSQLNTSYTTLMRAIERQDCIITTPESAQSLELKYIETLHDIFGLKIQEYTQPTLYEKMLTPFMTRGAAVLDEVHLVLNALSKTSYALQGSVHLPPVQVEIGQALFEAIILHNQQEHEAPYFPVGPRRKEPFIIEQYENILKPKLIECLVGHKNLKLPANMHHAAKEFLHFNRQSSDEHTRTRLTTWFQKLPKDVQDRIMLLRGHLHIYLPHALKTPYMMKYGPAIDDRETAIPYRHKGEPAKNSFFEKPEAEVSYTYLLYLNKGLDSTQVCTLIEGWQNIHKAESNVIPAGQKTPISQRFNQMCPKLSLDILNVADAETLRELTALFSFNHQAIFEYLAVYVFPQSTISKHKITSTCHNLVRMYMPENIAFSGTPTNFSTYPVDMRYLPERGSDGMLIHALMRSDICTLKVCDCLDPEKLTVFGNFSLLLDPQAYYDDMTNEKVVEKLLPTRSKQTVGIYFCSETNTLVRKTADSAPEPHRHHVVDERECIYYLDEMHCIGTDILLPTDTTALLLINKGLTFSKLTQSVKRLRQFGQSAQKITLCIDKNLASALAKQYSAVSMQNILQWTIDNEAEEIKKSLLAAYQQQIHAIYRARLLYIMIVGSAALPWNDRVTLQSELYTTYQDLLLDTIHLEQFYDDASIEPVKTTLEKLQNYSNSLYEKFKDILTEQDALLVQKTLETGFRYLSGQNEKIDDQAFDITSTQECQISLHTDEEAEERKGWMSTFVPDLEKLLLDGRFKSHFLHTDLSKLALTGYLPDEKMEIYFAPASRLFQEPHFDSSLFFTSKFIKMEETEGFFHLRHARESQPSAEDATEACLQETLTHSGNASEEKRRRFCKSLPHVRFVLAVRSIESKFFRYIALHELEANELRGLLSTLTHMRKKKFDGLHVQLINVHGDDLNPSSPQITAQVAHDRALAQFNFLNGNTVYTDAHAQALRSWFREDKTQLEKKLQFFHNMKHLRTNNTSLHYERSQLAHLFEETFQSFQEKELG